MSSMQKILVTFGAFWLSLWVAAVLGWPITKATNRITYTDTIFNAFALGAINSLSLTLAAVLAGILVTVVVATRKSELWALIVAVLYIFDAPVRYHWGYPASSWDRLWQGVALVFPAVGCIAAAVITARLRRKKKSSVGRVVPPSAAG